MLAKSWYDPAQDYFIIEFPDDPKFRLEESNIGKKQHWAMFTHGICAVNIDGGHLRFHRLGIVVKQMGGPNMKAALAERIEQAARILGYMGNTANLHAPGNLTSQQCLLASDILSNDQNSMLEACLKSYYSFTQETD